MKVTDEVLKEAQSRWCTQTKPEGATGVNKKRTFRQPGDKEPLGFVLNGEAYEVHRVDKRHIMVLTFNARGDAEVYAKKLKVLMCE